MREESLSLNDLIVGDSLSSERRPSSFHCGTLYRPSYPFPNIVDKKNHFHIDYFLLSSQYSFALFTRAHQ